jgi:hypothetical protein
MSHGQLYRLCYLRNGKPVGVTLWAADLVEALALQDMWEEVAKVKVLTLKALGASRFVNRGGRIEERAA